MTEPYFQKMNAFYENLLTRFMKHRWWAAAIIGLSLVLIVLFGKTLQSELAPLDDRSYLRLNVTAPEGASFEYTDAFMDNVSSRSSAIPFRKNVSA